ncbi:MAG: ABC-2 family transporter protein [Acidimicrobiia bacterium]|nr:ABC-2 family transporter protein [Acidimicrobiia bacterium]
MSVGDLLNADLAVGGRLAGAAVRASLGSTRLLVLRTLGSAVFVGTEVVGLVLLLDRFGRLGGWTTGEVVLLLGLAQVGLGLGMLLGDTLEPPVFSLLIREGRLDSVLTRPVPVLLWVMTSDVQARELGRASAGLVAALWGAQLAGVSASPLTLSVALLAVVCCTAVVVAILVFGASATFFTVEGSELVNAFTYGGATLSAYPMQIYGSVVRAVFLWLVPLGLTVYVPALTLLDRTGPPGVPASLLAVTPVATLAFGGVAALAWRAGLRHYTGTGS